MKTLKLKHNKVLRLSGSTRMREGEVENMKC